MAIRRSITNEPGWVTIVKPIDTNRLSTTTTADDPDITFTMEANKSYFLDLCMVLYVRATPDLKWGLTMPAGFFRAMQRIVAQHTTITQDVILAKPTDVVLDASTDNYGLIRITGPYATSASGAFSFNWAQNTSDGASAATVVAGSCLRYFKF
jgi:hypothetical protein